MMMMVANTRMLIDTNVLIRLHVPTAPQHQAVTEKFKGLLEQGYEAWISRQIIREYANVLTRPQTYAAPISSKEVVSQIRWFEQRYQVAEENALVPQNLYVLLETIPIGGKQVHDANLIATMQAYNITHLFTLNIDDFKRFSHLVHLLTIDS